MFKSFINNENVKKIMNMIPINISYDKKLHLCGGFIIAVLIGIFNITIGLICSIITGICKEIYDYHDYGKFDPMDMIVTWIGGIIGFIIITLLFKILS